MANGVFDAAKKNYKKSTELKVHRFLIIEHLKSLHVAGPLVIRDLLQKTVSLPAIALGFF
jgi:ribosome biogenesis protein Tsr3